MKKIIDLFRQVRQGEIEIEKIHDKIRGVRIQVPVGRTHQASQTAGMARSTHTFQRMNVVVLAASYG